ncbi:MAG: amidohydrolase [Halanaerobiales bacterium]
MLAITNGKIITMKEGQIFNKGTVLIKAGKIKKIGQNLEIPEGAKIIDATGKVVFPGLIDAHTHLGIGEEGIGWEGQDYNEMTDPITPHLRAIDAINPEDEGIKDAREQGITTVMTGPGSANVLGGENLVMKTAGSVIDEMVMKSPAGIKAAFGENPKRVYSDQQKTPSTRMAVAALMRETFMETQDYLQEKAKANEEQKSFKRDIKMESLARVLNREIPLKAHAHRADDILTILRIAREFEIDVTLEHCTEGHKVVSQIAEAGFPAIVGPTLTGKVKVELKNRSFKTAGILAKAGVEVALMSDHPVIPTYNLPLYAALAVKAGMPEQDALRAITINPARILGVDDRIGSLEAGKDADLVIFDGNPLQINTGVETVIINGEIIEE